MLQRGDKNVGNIPHPEVSEESIDIKDYPDLFTVYVDPEGKV